MPIFQEGCELLGDLSGGVAGVDDDECAHCVALAGAGVRAVQLLQTQRPALRLIEEVVCTRYSQLRQRTRKQRILRYRDHHRCNRNMLMSKSAVP